MLTGSFISTTFSTSHFLPSNPLYTEDIIIGLRNSIFIINRFTPYQPKPRAPLESNSSNLDGVVGEATLEDLASSLGRL